jgi:hypothetical protein
MAHKKDLSKTTSWSKTGLKTGVVGLALSLAGAAFVETSPADASVGPASQARSFALHEDEVIDTTIASFYVTDQETPGGARSHERYERQALCRCGKGRCKACPLSAPRCCRS